MVRKHAHAAIDKLKCYELCVHMEDLKKTTMDAVWTHGNGDTKRKRRQRKDLVYS